MNVLLLGATGLVGRECLALLLADPRVGHVHVLLRRPVSADVILQRAVPDHLLARMSTHIVDFSSLKQAALTMPQAFSVDAVFCALGSTMRQAGSKAAFRAVDHDYPLAAARLAKAHGARHYLLVSALGASPHSRVFYNQVKGEVETAIGQLAFDAFTVARPSLLMGKRTEFRPAEWLMARLAFLVPPPWAPVHVRQVARGLHEVLHLPLSGHRILDNMALRRHSGEPVLLT